MNTTETTESGLDAKALEAAGNAYWVQSHIGFVCPSWRSAPPEAKELARANVRAAIAAYLAALPSDTVETQGDDVRPQVREVMAEISVADGWGMWRTCTGCHETNEGAETGHYPYSEAFGCYLGSGCHECGGIGAIWDPTDYDDMARHMLARSHPASVETQGEPVATWQHHPDGFPYVDDGDDVPVVAAAERDYENIVKLLPERRRAVDYLIGVASRLHAAPQPTPAGALDPATVEACAKVAERLLKFADTTSSADIEIPKAIRSLTGGNGNGE